MDDIETLPSLARANSHAPARASRVCKPRDVRISVSIKNPIREKPDVSKTAQVSNMLALEVNSFTSGSGAIAIEENRSGVWTLLASTTIQKAAIYNLTYLPTTSQIRLTMTGPLRLQMKTICITKQVQVQSFLVDICSGLKDRYRFGFNGQEKVNEWSGVGNHLDFAFRGYDSRTGRFLGVDPVAQHFPWNSTYAFAENRVIDGIDFEGLEVMVVNKVHDAVIFNVGVKNTSQDEINVYAHGTPYRLGNNEPGKQHVWISTEEQFNQYMTKVSDQWRNRKHNGETVVVLHSCRTGRTTVSAKGKNNPSFAQRISAQFNITVIAPNERDNFSTDGELGPYVDKFEDQNGEHTSTDHSRSNTRGSWFIYKNGKLVSKYSGNWTPKASPTAWDKFWYSEDIKDSEKADVKVKDKKGNNSTNNDDKKDDGKSEVHLNTGSGK